MISNGGFLLERAATPSQTIQKLNLAAQLRVEGNSWAIVAKHIGRDNADSARHITQEHREEWEAAYREAHTKYLSEIEAEAILTQRAAMRLGGDEPTNEQWKIRQQAAHSVLNHARRSAPQKIEIGGSLGHTLSNDQVRAVDLELRKAGLRNGREIKLRGNSPSTG